VACGVTTTWREPLRARTRLEPPTAGALRADGIATGSASRASLARAGAHATAAAAAWFLLVCLWLLQFHGRHIPDSWRTSVFAVAGGVVLFAGFCVAWVTWNRNIYRRRHQRVTPVSTDVQFTHDALGRRIVERKQGRQASQLVVEIDEASAFKHYVVVRP
jgi:hypothetical protein